MFKKLLCMIFFLPILVHAAEFVEGKDYEVIVNAKTSASKTPQITEFFSYGCPSCFKIEAPLTAWVSNLGKSIEFTRVPVVFHPNWDLYAKAFYTAKTLALTEKMDPILFKAIIVDKKTLNKESMTALFVSQGIDKEIAKSAFENSPTIDLQVNEGISLMSQYQINAVPAFVVNKKYKTDLQKTGGPERLFEVLNYLIKKPG